MNYEIIDVKISNIGETITGKTPSSSSPEDFGNEFMFITPSDEFDKKYINKTNRYLSSIGYNNLKSKSLKPNSVLVSCIGSAMGKVTMNSDFAITNQQINSIVVNENKYSSHYIYYLLKNNYNILRNAASGSTALPLLNKTDFDELKLKVHVNLKTQQKIAAVLSSLDDKIELNNKINAELEAMAKTLYDYWFVQFEFSNSEGKPYKSSGGAMEYNPILKREIPKGWEVSVFNDWIRQTKTGDWGKDEIEGNYTERVFCVRGADINGLNGKGEVKAPQRFILKNNLSKKLEPNDFIIEISGGSPIQSTARIALLTKESFDRFDTDVVCSNFCKAVTMKDEIYAFNFQQEWQRLYDAGVFFGFEGKTSGIKNFLFDSFMESYHIVKAPQDLAQKYNLFATELERKRQLNLKQNQELAQLRDWLLPMLMNGQVKVENTYSSSEQQTNIAAEAAIAYQN